MSNNNLTETNARRYLDRIKSDWIAKYPNEILSEVCFHNATGAYLYIKVVTDIHFEWVVWFEQQPKGCIEVGLHFETEKYNDEYKDKENNLLILNTLDQYGKCGKITLPKEVKFKRDFPSIKRATRICLLTKFISAYDMPSIKWAIENMEEFREALEPGLAELKKVGIIP